MRALDSWPWKLMVFHCLLGGLQAWGAARRVSKDDWLEWLRRLSLELLKDSSSPSLRSCWALAQAYNPMARYVPRFRMGSRGSAQRRRYIRILSYWW